MLIVNPNFTTDRTVHLRRLVPGEVIRTDRAQVTLGGKGVNVARVARAFGRRAPVVGFVAERGAAVLAALADGEGAELVAVPAAGEVRAATILLEDGGRVTVLNEPGPEVDANDWDHLAVAVEALGGEHGSICCSGSLPPGSSPDSYARLVVLAHLAELRAIVDAAGPVLLAALEVGPDVVTPNLAEAEAALFGAVGEGVEPTGDEIEARARNSAAALVAAGARHAVVTVASHGAGFAGPDGVSFVAAPAVKVVSPIGAGDAFVGGLTLALEANAGFDEAVGFAVAVAAASCEQPLAGGVDPARVGELVPGLAEIVAGQRGVRSVGAT